MGTFLSYRLFPIILNMSLTAALVILAVLLARLALRRAPKVFSYVLWAVVLFRLLCPVSVSSAVSLLGALDAPVRERSTVTSVVEYVPADIVRDPTPQVTLIVPTVSNTVNNALPQGTEQTAADPLAGPMALITLTWLAGIAVLLVWSLASLLRLRRRLVGAVRLRDNIYLADHIPSPFVMGLFRPKIYLPSTLTETERGYILRHEQYHIRRGDHLIKLLAFLALCIHWFNPLVWAAFFLSGKDMEMSCDEAVVRELGEDIRADYSASLLSLATGHRILAGMPLAFGEGDTGSRIRNLLRRKPPRPWLVAVSAVVCVALIAACAANPKGSAPADTPANTPAADSGKSGQWADMEDYVQSVMLAETEVTYWTYNATRDNTEDQVTSPVTDRKLEYLEKGGELAGLAPEGTLEEWFFNYLVKFDADPETVMLAGGQSCDDEGYFSLTGSHEVVALRYGDGSYDVLYDECSWDHFDFYNYCENIQEVLHDWYVKEYGLDRPLYVVDWAEQLQYNDDQNHGNFPLHRFDGDGFSIYVPVQAWVMQEPTKNHWEWYSAYDSGSTIVVDRFTQSLEDDYVAAQKQGFAPLDGTRQVWTRRQGGINERYWFYPAADGNGSWRVWTLWTDEGVSDYPYIFIEPQTMYLMAEHFLVTETAAPQAAASETVDASVTERVANAAGCTADITLRYTITRENGAERIGSIDGMQVKNVGGWTAVRDDGVIWDTQTVYLNGGRQAIVPVTYEASLGSGYDPYFAVMTIDLDGAGVAHHALTDAEIEAWNEQLDPMKTDEKGNLTEIGVLNSFYTSYYSDVRELDLLQFLWYFPADGTASEAEFEALKQLDGWSFGADVTLDTMPVPVHRIDAAEVDRVLRTYTDITTADLTNTEGVLYLEYYNAYYVFTSDAGFGMFTADSAQQVGNRIYFIGQDRSLLTVRVTENGGWQLVSHLSPYNA